MKKDNGHPSLQGVKIKRKLFKLLTIFIIIVLICTGCGIFYAKDLTYGYKHYQLTEGQTIQIGVTQQENFIEKTINEYLEELGDKGYYVASSELDIETMVKETVVRKSQINDEDFKTKVINHLDVDVLTTTVKFKDDDTTYYFKTENEARVFINELNKYIEQECSVESSIEDYSLITSDDILEQKRNDVIKQKEEADAAAAAKKAAEEKAKKQQQQVTSRGGYDRSSSGTIKSGQPPMASYVYISSPYGMRHGSMHTGTDFAASSGTAVYAWKDGTVTTACWNGGYGNFIEIKHNDGTVSRYAHLSGYAISAGQTVSKGQTIGYVGSTGNSTGPHLHFEIKINGSFVNPVDYL